MVKWTDHAKAQLRHIHDYIAQDSPIYAKRVADALVHKTQCRAPSTERQDRLLLPWLHDAATP